jgi:hypothetical protein
VPHGVHLERIQQDRLRQDENLRAVVIERCKEASRVGLPADAAT